MNLKDINPWKRKEVIGDAPLGIDLFCGLGGWTEGLLAEGYEVISIDVEMRSLADRYVRAGIFPSRYFSDALHTSAAVLSNADILVSWNFKHLVKRSTRLWINSMNAKLGLRSIEILAPPEL